MGLSHDPITRRDFNITLLAGAAAAAASPALAQLSGATLEDFVLAEVSPIRAAWRVNADTLRRAAAQGKLAAAAIDCDVFDAADDALMRSHLVRLHEAGFRGVGLHAPVCAIDDPRNLTLFHAAATLRLPVVLRRSLMWNHGWADGRGLSRVRRAVPGVVLLTDAATCPG